MLDVRIRHTDGKASKAPPGESLEFLAQIRGWQSEERKKRKAQLLQLNDIGLRVALGHAVGPDVIFIPHHRTHSSAHGHMQRRAYMRALADVYIRNVAYVAYSSSRERDVVYWYSI